MDNVTVSFPTNYLILFWKLITFSLISRFILTNRMIWFRCYAGKAGWQGEDCSIVDQQVYQCLPGCSERGTYDLETGTCICDRHWTGPDCSQGKKEPFLMIIALLFFSIEFWGFFRPKDDEFLWLSHWIWKRFLKTELKDLRHKYSIFHLIHLSKSKFFSLPSFFISVSAVCSLISSFWDIYCGSTFHIQVNFRVEI